MSDERSNDVENDVEYANLSVTTGEVLGRLLLAVSEIRTALGLAPVDWWAESNDNDYATSPLGQENTAKNRRIIAQVVVKELPRIIRHDTGSRNF